jgi:hypothetical protein
MIAGLLAATAAGAAGLRDVGSFAKPVCNVPHPRAIWGFQPGCSGLAIQGERQVKMAYNQLGLRDHDYPATAPAGTLRILVMGSSNLVGPGLEEGANPVRQMEKMLRERGVKAEVVNGATEGYFAAQNAVRLQEYLDAYHPQIVLFDFLATMGIFGDAALEPVMEYSNGVPVALHLDPTRLAPESYRKRIYANPGLTARWRTLDEYLRRISATWKARIAGGIFRADPERVAESFLGPSLRYLAYMRNASARAGAEFFVMYQPGQGSSVMYNVPPGFDFPLAEKLQRLVYPVNLPGPLVDHTLERAGVPLLPITRPMGPGYVLPGEYHFNELGARTAGAYMADALVPKLREKGLVKELKPARSATSKRQRDKPR